MKKTIFGKNYYPAQSSYELFGSFLVDSESYRGTVLAQNGKLYGIPYRASQVVEIDPITKNISYFGSIGGDYRYMGGVLHPNGKIYSIPFGADSILEIDPISKTIAFVAYLGGGYKYNGCVLAENGKVYGFGSYNVGSVIEFNPYTQTFLNFGATGGSRSGGVLANNGKIYSFPEESTQVLEIDTVTKTTSLFGNTLSYYTIQNGTLASDGFIYCASPSNIIKIDTVNKTTSFLNSYENIGSYGGGYLASNGKIYFLPFSSSKILEFDPITQTVLLLQGEIFNNINKYLGGAVFGNQIFSIPYSVASALQIDVFGDIIIDTEMPPLSELANSQWNKYYNKY